MNPDPRVRVHTRMKRYVLALAVLTLTVAGCGSAASGSDPDPDPDPSPVSDRPLVDTHWVVERLVHGGRESTPLGQGAGPFLDFSAELVNGNGGCNAFGGEYTAEGQTVTFGQIIHTEIACPADGVMESENTILGVLSGPVTATVDGDTLTITHPSGDAIVLCASGG